MVCVFFFFFIFSFERLHKYFIFKEALTNITNFCLVLLCFCFVLLLFRFIFSLSQLFVFLLLFVFGFFIWSYFCTTLMRNIFLSTSTFEWLQVVISFYCDRFVYIGIKKQILTAIKGFSPKSLSYSSCLKFAGCFSLHVAFHTH